MMIKKLKTYEDNFYLEMLKRFGRLMVLASSSHWSLLISVCNDAFFSTLSKEVL